MQYKKRNGEPTHKRHLNGSLLLLLLKLSL
jgi:hypothetical protein